MAGPITEYEWGSGTSVQPGERGLQSSCREAASVMQAGLVARAEGGFSAMPEGSTKKQKRQYEHIKESYKDRGVSTKEAKERAARTVNKERGKKK